VNCRALIRYLLVRDTGWRDKVDDRDVKKACIGVFMGYSGQVSVELGSQVSKWMI
jgi:hypothetical protein